MKKSQPRHLFLTAIVLLSMMPVSANWYSSTTLPVVSDYKITQKRTMEGMGQEFTIYSKGVRERRESKTIMEGLDAEEAAMMAKMMPSMPTTITQCDLKQNVSINESKKFYFIDYYEPPQPGNQPLPKQKVVVKGTATISSTVADSGKRQQMFGLTAKWLKSVRTIDTSADSCEGRSSIKIEQEGWFVDLTLEQDRCEAPPIQLEKGGCRPKLIIKSSQNPGFFLSGTEKMYIDNKLQTTSTLETTALSKATLDLALFEVPKNYKQVDSFSELMGAGEVKDSTATTVFTDTGKTVKTVAIDFFSGSTSKIDQDGLREYISQKLSAANLSGRLVNSQAEISGGNFANTITVEIKKVKESGASKIGGLFGKVTGNDDASKIGDSEAEIVMNVLGKDGKTVVGSATGSAKVKGKGDDAVKAAIDKVIDGVIAKLK